MERDVNAAIRDAGHGQDFDPEDFIKGIGAIAG
jgi:hypothetical protein